MSRTVVVDRAASGVAAQVPGPRAARARRAVVAALEASDVALGAWEAGSAAFGRADEDSDLDVGVLCAPDAGDQVLDEIELALRTVTPALDVYRAGATPFGVQRFWQASVPADEASICMVDVSVMEHVAQEDKWRELLTPERHGRALPLHDPDDVLRAATSAVTFDADAHRERIAEELLRVRARRPMFGPFVEKELGRGRVLDAHWIHERMILTPLIALLGIRYRPLRFDFGLRYLHEELPADVVECLLALVQPPRTEPLQRTADAGLAWIDRLLDELDPTQLPIEEHAAQMRAAFGPA